MQKGLEAILLAAEHTSVREAGAQASISPEGFNQHRIRPQLIGDKGQVTNSGSTREDTGLGGSKVLLIMSTKDTGSKMVCAVQYA